MIPMHPIKSSIPYSFIVLLCLSVTTLPAAEIALSFSGNHLVDRDVPLREMRNRGQLDRVNPLSPGQNYRGPVFFGGYGRSANGSVDNARILNDAGPYGQDMLDFNEGTMGVVDQMYGAVIFRSESFEGRFRNRPISLARQEALSIRTFTGFVPQQVGWLYFYIEVGDRAYLSPPFSFTRDVDAGWGEKVITVNNPRSIRWSEAVFRDGTPFVAGERPEAAPDFDAVTGVGFVFHTASQRDNPKDAVRFLTDFFLVAAE
jgi:hypothetical protein